MTFEEILLGARAYIKGNEGLVLSIYKDTLGFRTVGYGHLIQPSEVIPEQITLAQAEMLFEADFHKALSAVTASPVWSELLAPGRIIALIDLTFNMGVGWIRTFTATNNAMIAGDWNLAGDLLLQSKYASQVPNRAERNANLLRTGLSPNQPNQPPTPAATDQSDSPSDVSLAEPSPPQTEFSDFSGFSGFSSFSK